MTPSRIFSALALVTVSVVGGFVADASAQSRRFRDSCDEICISRPNAQCYQACFASNGERVSSPGRSRRVQPVSVQSQDWRSVVYNTNAPGRGGNSGGGNAGGGGGKGK